MAAVKTTMGYEAQLFIGTAGTTGATQVTEAQDVDYNLDPERGNTTSRGDGLSVPIVTSRVTALKPTVTFKVLKKLASSTLATIIAAAKTGAPLAVRTKSASTGYGFDGDMNFSMKEGSPLNGEGTWEFTCEADESALRVPSLWV